MAPKLGRFRTELNTQKITSVMAKGISVNFYVKLKNIPELAPLSQAQRTEVWARNSGAIFRDPLIILALLVCILFMGLGNFLGQRFLPWEHGYLAGPVLFFPVSYAFFWSWATERLRPGLKEIVNQLYGNDEKCNPE